jgi:hypothetical protein
MGVHLKAFVKLSMITHEYLKEKFNYDPSTGILSNRVSGKQYTKLSNQGYAKVCVLGTQYPVHRIIWFWVYGDFPWNDIDHINRVRHDNRIENLRDVTPRQNSQNLPKHSIYGCGVRKEKSGVYFATASIKSKSVNLGRYNTMKEAQAAYNVFSTYGIVVKLKRSTAVKLPLTERRESVKEIERQYIKIYLKSRREAIKKQKCFPEKIASSKM